MRGMILFVSLLVAAPGHAQSDWNTILGRYQRSPTPRSARVSLQGLGTQALCSPLSERPDSVEIDASPQFTMQAWHGPTQSYLHAETPSAGPARFRLIEQWCIAGSNTPAELSLERDSVWVRVFYARGLTGARYHVGGMWAEPRADAHGFGTPAFRTRIADSMAVIQRQAAERYQRYEALADSAKRADSVATHTRLRRAGYTPATIRMILRGEIAIGWSRNAVLESWGEPSSVNRTITRAGTHEQWVYRDAYVYLDNGRVTAIQDSR